MADPRLNQQVFSASYARYAAGRDMYGPFHRVRSPSQDAGDDQRQIASGMLWGRTPRGGKCPTAQAYFGPLPAGTSGVEFMTAVKPHQLGLPAGHGAAWYFDDTAFTGLYKRNSDNVDFAVITIIVTKHVP